MKYKDLLTDKTRVILASSSKVRKNYIKKYFMKVTAVEHLIDEKQFKYSNKTPEAIVLDIARAKATSVERFFSKDLIIASDQILVCDQKIFSKPINIEEGIKNLIFLRNKIHTLVSSIYVLKNGKFFYEQVKKAKLLFKNIPKSQIEEYAKKNKETILSTVGSYKIEENNKHNFLKIITGDTETIIGFPISDLMRKIHEEK